MMNENPLGNPMKQEAILKATPTRRDFLILSTGAVGAVGAASLLWPFVDSMNPAADTLALSTVDVDIKSVQPGQAITVMWQGKPVFIRHRTEQETAIAREIVLTDLRDPEKDEDRTENKDWLIVIGICTHLGCVPLGQKSTEPRGEYKGWFCPCHGSEYDLSGRIRKGPAPTNLAIPPYEFLTPTSIRIGVAPANTVKKS